MLWEQSRAVEKSGEEAENKDYARIRSQVYRPQVEPEKVRDSWQCEGFEAS